MSEETADFSSNQSIQLGMCKEIPQKEDPAQKDKIEYDQLIVSKINSGKSLASTNPDDNSMVEGPSDGSHFSSLQHQTTFAPLSSLHKNNQPSYSQQKIAYVQPYTQPDQKGLDNNSQYFTSQQEKIIYNHLRELIKVYKSGYLDKHTLIDIINKEVKKEGWKSLEGQISTSVIDEFLDRHEDIKCYIDTDIRIALLQENILYSHIVNYMSNLKSNNQIDKDILYNIVKEQVNEYGWENLYSISKKWVDSFLERHSDLKKFVVSKEIEKNHRSIKDDNPVEKNTHDPIKIVHVNPPSTPNISERSNLKTPKTRPKETDSRSWGIISDVFSLNPASIDETAEFSEKDLEFLSLSSSFRKVTAESSNISEKNKNTQNLPIGYKKKELENQLSLIQSKFKKLPRKHKSFLSTTSRIADAVTSQKADTITTSRIADSVTSEKSDPVTTSQKEDALTSTSLNIQHQNTPDTIETESSDLLLPSIECLEKSGQQLKKGGKTRMTVGMTDLLAFTFQHEHFPSSTNMARLAKIMGIHWSRVRNWFTKQRLECKKAQYFVPKDKPFGFCPYCNLTLKDPKEQKEHLFHPEHIQKALQENVQTRSSISLLNTEGVPVNSVTPRDLISNLSSQPSKGIKSMAPNLQNSSLSQNEASNVKETYSTLNNSRVSISKADITLSAPSSLLTTSEVTSTQDDPLNEDCGITKTFYAKDPTNPEISHKYFIKTKIHQDGKTYEYLYREDGKINKLIGTKELTQDENSKSPSESQPRNNPQQDQDDRIEDDSLMASEEISDKVCINCLFEYGDEDAWITCYICSFWLHKHCSVLYDKEGTLICPPCSLKQTPVASGSGFKSKKDISILNKSTTVLASKQNSDKVVNSSINNLTTTFDKDNPKILVPELENNTSGDYKGDKNPISIDTVNSSDFKNKRIKEKIHVKDMHCPICTKTIDKEYWVKCGFCKKIVHKLCGKLFLASSSKAMKWHCPSCKNMNPIRYDPQYLQDLIYKMNVVEYESEPRKYLSKKEEEELVLYILVKFNEKRIGISKFKKILLSFVRRKDGPFKKDRGSYDIGWMQRFINRHPMLKEIVSVTEMDNENESLVPTTSPKRSKTGVESLAEYVKKEVSEASPLKEKENTSYIPRALPEVRFKRSSKRLTTGTDLETETTVKKELPERELSVEEHLLFTITNELRDIIPVEMLDTGLQDESINEENQSTSEIMSIPRSNDETINKLKQTQSDGKSSLSDLADHCKEKSYSVERKRDNYDNKSKNNQNLKCSLNKQIRKQKCKFGIKKLSIILERLPLELCETVEGRNILVSRILQNEVDDSAIVCVGCKTNRGSMSSWLGCDSCSAWWHIKCAGLPTKLTKRQIQDMDWNCPTCKKTKELLSGKENNMSKNKYLDKPKENITKRVTKEHFKSDSKWPLSVLNIIGKCWNCKNCLQILPCEICINCKDDSPRQVKKLCESKKCTNPQMRVKGFVERFYYFNSTSPPELPELYRLSKKCRECSGCTLPVCGKCINCKRAQHVRKIICKGSKRLCIKKKCVNPIVSLEAFVTCAAIELNFKESVIEALKCDQRFNLNHIPYCASCRECRKPNCGQCQYCQEDQFALDKGGCKIKCCMEKMCILTIRYGSKSITPGNGDISEISQENLPSTVPSGVFTMTEEDDQLEIDVERTNPELTNLTMKPTIADVVYDDDLPDLTINDHLYMSPEKRNVEEIEHDSDLLARSDVSDEEGDTIPCEGCSYIGGSPFWLCCDGCNGWWHRKCAGIARYTTDENIQKMFWKCPTCVAQTFLSESKVSTEISLNSQSIEQGNDLKNSGSDESFKKFKGNRNKHVEYEKTNKNFVDYQKKTGISVKHRNRRPSNINEDLETDYIDVETLDDSGEDDDNTAKCNDKNKPENYKVNDGHCSECKTVTNGCKDYNDYFKILEKMQLEQIKRKSMCNSIKRAKFNKSDTVLVEKEISSKNSSYDICSESKYQSGFTHKDHSTDIINTKSSAFLTKSIIEESITDYYKILQKLQVEQLKRKENFTVPKSLNDSEPNTLSAEKVISTSILSYDVCSKKRNHEEVTQQIKSPDEQNTGDESNFFLRKNNINEKLLIGDDKIANLMDSARKSPLSAELSKVSIKNLDSDSFLEKVTEPGFDPFRLYRKSVFQPKMSKMGEFLGFEDFNNLEKSKSNYIKSNNKFSGEEWFTDEELEVNEIMNTKSVEFIFGNEFNNVKYIEEEKSNNAKEYKCGKCGKHSGSPVWACCNSCTIWRDENCVNCEKPQGSKAWISCNSCSRWRHKNCTIHPNDITLNQVDKLSWIWNCHACVKSNKESLSKETGCITSYLNVINENISKESEIADDVINNDGQDDSEILPETSDVSDKIIHIRNYHTKGELFFKSKETGTQNINEIIGLDKSALLYDINDVDNEITDENIISEKGELLFQTGHIANKITERYISAKRREASIKTNNINKISDGNTSKDKLLSENIDIGKRRMERNINCSKDELLFDTDDDGCEISDDLISEGESIIDTAFNLSGIDKSEISEINYNSTKKNPKKIFLDFAQVIDTSLSEIKEKVKNKEYQVLGFTKGNGANVTVTECHSSNVNADKCIVSFAKVIDNDISKSKELREQGICNNENVDKDDINSSKCEVLLEKTDVILGINDIVTENDKDEIFGDSFFSLIDSDHDESFLGFDDVSIMKYKNINYALEAHRRQEMCTEFVNCEWNTKLPEKTDFRKEIKNSMNQAEVENEKLLNEKKYKANCKESLDKTKLKEEKLQTDVKVNLFLEKNDIKKFFFEERKENEKLNINSLKEKKEKVSEEDNQIKCFGCGKCRIKGDLIRCNSCTCWWHRICGGAHRAITSPGLTQELNWSCPLCFQDNTPWTITNETNRDHNSTDSYYVPQPNDTEESLMSKSIWMNSNSSRPNKYSKSNNGSESSQRQFEMKVTSAQGKMVYISNIPIEKDISKKITWEKGKNVKHVDSTELVKNTRVIKDNEENKHLEIGFNEKMNSFQNMEEVTADEKSGSATVLMSCIDVFREKKLPVISQCGGCLTNIEAVSNWISCQTCGCLWHKRCAKESEEVTLNEIKEIEWHCPICLETLRHPFLESSNVDKPNEMPMKTKSEIPETKESYKLPKKMKNITNFLAKGSSKEYLSDSCVTNSLYGLSSGLTEKPAIAQSKGELFTKQAIVCVTRHELESATKQTNICLSHHEQGLITKQSSTCIIFPQDKEFEEIMDKECKENNNIICEEPTKAAEVKTMNSETERKKSIEACDNGDIGRVARRSVTRPAWMQSGEFSGYGRLKTELKKKKNEKRGKIRNTSALKLDLKKKKSEKKCKIKNKCTGCQSYRGQKKSWIKCCKCFGWWHRKCTDVSKHTYAILIKKNTWNCVVCMNGFENEKIKASNIVTYENENLNKSNDSGNMGHENTEKKIVKSDSKIIKNVEEITKVEEMIRCKDKSIKIDSPKKNVNGNLMKKDFKKGNSSHDKTKICEYDDDRILKQSVVPKTRKNRKVSGISPKSISFSETDLAPVLSNCWDTMSTLFQESDLSETTLTDNANDSIIDIPNADVDFTYIDTDLTTEETDKLNLSQSDLNILTAALDGLGNDDLKILDSPCDTQKILNDLDSGTTLSPCSIKEDLRYTDNTCNTSINTLDNQSLKQPPTSPGIVKDNLCRLPAVCNDTNKNIQDRSQNHQIESLLNGNKSKKSCHPSVPILKMPKLTVKKKSQTNNNILNETCSNSNETVFVNKDNLEENNDTIDSATDHIGNLKIPVDNVLYLDKICSKGLNSSDLESNGQTKTIFTSESKKKTEAISKHVVNNKTETRSKFILNNPTEKVSKPVYNNQTETVSESVLDNLREAISTPESNNDIEEIPTPVSSNQIEAVSKSVLKNPTEAIFTHLLSNERTETLIDESELNEENTPFTKGNVLTENMAIHQVDHEINSVRNDKVDNSYNNIEEQPLDNGKYLSETLIIPKVGNLINSVNNKKDDNSYEEKEAQACESKCVENLTENLTRHKVDHLINLVQGKEVEYSIEEKEELEFENKYNTPNTPNGNVEALTDFLVKRKADCNEEVDNNYKIKIENQLAVKSESKNNVSNLSVEALSDSMSATDLDHLPNSVNSGTEVNINYNAKENLLAIEGNSNDDGLRPKVNLENLTESSITTEVDHLIISGMKPKIDDTFKKLQQIETYGQDIAFEINLNCEATCINQQNNVVYPACSASSYNIPILDIDEISDFSNLGVSDNLITDVLNNYVSIDVSSLHAIYDYDDIGHQQNLCNENNWSLEEYSPVRKKRFNSEYANISNTSVDIGNSHIRVTSDEDYEKIPSNYIITGIATVTLNGDEHNLEKSQKKSHHLYKYSQLMDMYKEDKRRLVVQVEQLKLPLDLHKKSSKRKRSEKDPLVDSKIKDDKMCDVSVHKSQQVLKICRKRTLSVRIKRLELPSDECFPTKFNENIQSNLLPTHISNNQKNEICQNKDSTKFRKDHSKSKSSSKCDVKTVKKLAKKYNKKLDVKKDNKKSTSKFRSGIKLRSMYKASANICKPSRKSTGVIINAGKILKRAPIKNKNHNTLIMVNSKTKSISVISNENESLKKPDSDKSIPCTNNLNLSHSNDGNLESENKKVIRVNTKNKDRSSRHLDGNSSYPNICKNLNIAPLMKVTEVVYPKEVGKNNVKSVRRILNRSNFT